jgi:hypothetical protein
VGFSLQTHDEFQKGNSSWLPPIVNRKSAMAGVAQTAVPRHGICGFFRAAREKPQT